MLYAPLFCRQVELRKFRAQAAWFRQRHKLDLFLRWFRSCTVCSCTLPPIDLLCASCWKNFASQANYGKQTYQVGYPFPVYSLLTWSEQNDHMARLILKGQKKGYAVLAIRKLTERLAFERWWPADAGIPIIVYPPSATGHPDHAALIATELACLWGGLPLKLQWQSDAKIPGKSGTTGGPQKGRNAIGRTERRFLELDLATFTLPSTRWIFVDDVITTGSTAMAAYMALGAPECFETWTLICRPKLANPKGF